MSLKLTLNIRITLMGKILDALAAASGSLALGGLISHIELTECRSIPRQAFDSGRTERTEWHRNYQNARNFRDYGRTAGDFSESPNPLMKPQPSSLLVDGSVGSSSSTTYGMPPSPYMSSSRLMLESPKPTLRL